MAALDADMLSGFVSVAAYFYRPRSEMRVTTNPNRNKFSADIQQILTDFVRSSTDLCKKHEQITCLSSGQ